MRERERTFRSPQTGLSKNYVHAGLDHVKKEIPVLLKKGLHSPTVTAGRTTRGRENRRKKKAEGIVSIYLVSGHVKGIYRVPPPFVFSQFQDEIFPSRSGNS